ncbi:thiazole biosynthesis protein [Candidatus Erwinia haradaeae]|uniref:tRNA sulfurtransferase, partial n=1 Tax=Candidatus Erwinia haradaeae TaxID=1922217 RepID=A0A451DKN7_9GAMM|nr:thiazole biosynthesis protein [Candidatus Erwinia haradaeae]VFP87275.1 tRNA sulfurtransferase [Candidatus Erwinia haradaeae]
MIYTYKNTMQSNQNLNQTSQVLQYDQQYIVLDIRSQDEQEDHPLELANFLVKTLPFYYLDSQFSSLDQNKSYLLYCNNGLMSRLQMLFLREKGFNNVSIYCA